jgi:hypothetical protein
VGFLLLFLWLIDWLIDCRSSSHHNTQSSLHAVFVSFVESELQQKQQQQQRNIHILVV